MRYSFDLDGTLCSQTEGGRYLEAQPYPEAIAEVNRLYRCGHEIAIVTARGNGSGTDWLDRTKRQLEQWGVMHHLLEVGKKRGADVYIDDRARNAIEWRSTLQGRITGIIAGAFDFLHPGYIRAFQEGKRHCNYLVVALHTDPTIERPHKRKPILSVEDRERALRECRSVDEVVRYTTEAEFVALLSNIRPDVRLLGDDYRGAKVTGEELGTKKVFLDRSHGFSMTKVRELIASTAAQEG